jgi:hypothetical protein
MKTIDLKLKKYVFEMLANAVENGYEDFLKTHSDVEVAEDLQGSDSELEQIETAELAVIVSLWQGGER